MKREEKELINEINMILNKLVWSMPIGFTVDISDLEMMALDEKMCFLKYNMREFEKKLSFWDYSVGEVYILGKTIGRIEGICAILDKIKKEKDK